METEKSGGGPLPDRHTDINPATGQQRAYVVLTPEERAKGFVRPVRRAYLHVGARPTYPLRDLTPEEQRGYGPGYVKYEEYPADMAPLCGRAWKAEQIGRGCGALTIMATDIAETYARDPHFYSGTYCVGCRAHFPVAEFVWDGTDDRVGS